MYVTASLKSNLRVPQWFQCEVHTLQCGIQGVSYLDPGYFLVFLVFLHTQWWSGKCLTRARLSQWFSSKESPTVQEIQVRSLGQKDPLKKGMPTHSGILAWKIPWTVQPAGYSPWSLKELDTTEQLIHPQEE